jgi:hypothetical protein
MNGFDNFSFIFEVSVGNFPFICEVSASVFWASVSAGLEAGFLYVDFLV